MKRTRRKFSVTASPVTPITIIVVLTVLILIAILSLALFPEKRIGAVPGTMPDTMPGTSPDTSPDTRTVDMTAAGPASLQTIKPQGTRPAHLLTDPSAPVPNQQAIKAALWAPGIDHGYVPQGLAFAEGQVLISAYRSTSPAVSMGPCRVYRIDPDSGTITGFFDLPPACGHAGGLAYAGGGVLILSDTRKLYRINLELALREQHAQNAITGTLELRGALRGSFVTFVPVTFVPVTFVPVTFVPAAAVPATAWPRILTDNQPGSQPNNQPNNPPSQQPGNRPETGPENGPGMFIGAWSTSASKARGYFLPLGLFDSHSGSSITETSAIHSIPLAARAQGAAFAPDGSFWISYSSHDFGRVEEIHPASGKVLASHPLVSGTEDISFDELGSLWAVSEAGSLRWRSWRTSFPVVFRLDIALLK